MKVILETAALTDEQIAEIGTTKKAMLDIPIYSKYDGHVHEMQNGEMNKEEMSDYSKSPLLSIKEGMYVEKGEKLFNVISRISPSFSDLLSTMSSRQLSVHFDSDLIH